VTTAIRNSCPFVRHYDRSTNGSNQNFLLNPTTMLYGAARLARGNKNLRTYNE